MNAAILGFVFVLIGATCGGSFGLPSKFVKKDTPWEVLWGPVFLFIAVIIPTVIAPLVVNDLIGVYRDVETKAPGTVATVLAIGFFWGLGTMTLGKAFAFIGLSLATAINFGTQIVTGAMVPMAIHNPGHMVESHGMVVIAGVAVCVVGVIIAGRAAILRDRSTRGGGPEAAEPEPIAAGKTPRMLIGHIIGVASGVLCACWAIASSFGKIITDVANVTNADWPASWPLTALILWGGAVSSCGYCAWQLTKNKTWSHFKKPGVAKVLVLALAIAVLHDAAVLFLVLGFIYLGTLGISVGYATFMSFAIMVGNFHGFRTGEWKGASGQSIKLILIGIAVLVVGVSILAIGNAMTPN